MYASTIGTTSSTSSSSSLLTGLSAGNNIHGGQYISHDMVNSAGDNSSTTSNSATGRSQLWMGDLEIWMDEPFLRQVWHQMGENVLVKMIRDRATGGPANYCFIEFSSLNEASRALVAYNGQLIPNTTKPFRLNWATGNNDRKDERGTEYSVFVGDLGNDVNDYMLLTTFQVQYPSVRSAKVVTDALTSLSRGYGFVRFGDEVEQQRAIIEMQGRYCGSRPMRISLATPKTRRDTLSDRLSDRDTNVYNPNTDPHNTTVFVGGLTHPVSEDELRSVFQVYGHVIYCKIPPNKGCGFVTFERRDDAEKAIHHLNGYVVGQSRIRLSWGRSQSHARVFSVSGGSVATSIQGQGFKANSIPQQAFSGFPQQVKLPTTQSIKPPHPPYGPSLIPSHQAPMIIGAGSAQVPRISSSNTFPMKHGSHQVQQQQPPRLDSKVGFPYPNGTSQLTLNTFFSFDNSIWSPLDKIFSTTTSQANNSALSGTSKAATSNIDHIDWKNTSNSLDTIRVL
ncbi:hypothetical protein H4219_000749 [Mycoemilia scoparia]|uniref:RRM domain-containing protein n=1 Tax=Mycoemilia scoparia TaxID=417184 RepID=A0A9W8DWH9_9FUNG|nr:hypothetical protein H4219_000749 [Mycoemilia scoparia]